MNSWKIYTDRLDDIIEATAEIKSLSEACGLYSAARWITADLEEHLKIEKKWDSYAGEKIFKTMWSIGALTGFDVDNGHSAQQHRAWAKGSLITLIGLLEEKFPRDE